MKLVQIGWLYIINQNNWYWNICLSIVKYLSDKLDNVQIPSAYKFVYMSQ